MIEKKKSTYLKQTYCQKPTIVESSREHFLASIKTEPSRLKNIDHICLTNNSYFSTPNHLMEQKHNNSINQYHQNLVLKEAKTPEVPRDIDKKWYTVLDYYSLEAPLKDHFWVYHSNPTKPCSNVNINTSMREKIAQPSA